MAPGHLSAAGGTGPFITWVVHLDETAGHQLTTSRRLRKGLSPLTVASVVEDPGKAALGRRNAWHRFWAPERIGWWIALLFMIGALHFALASAAALWPQSWLLQEISPSRQGWIYFFGALFFTAAAFLQWLEAHNNDIGALIKDEPEISGSWRLFGWCPRNLGYLAALVQFTGTLLFNLNTTDALVSGLGLAGQDLLVWAPDVLGSICFLVASQLAVMELSHARWSWQPRSLAWWIVAINLLGSIFFMVSALSAVVVPGPHAAAPLIANLGTFAGALCFSIAAYLLIPELLEEMPVGPRR